jgi:hypothetical protein
LGAEWRWTSRRGFWYRGRRWKLCNTWPQMKGNDEKKWMEDLEVKTILTLELKWRTNCWMIIAKAKNWCFIVRWTMKYKIKNLWSKNLKLVYQQYQFIEGFLLIIILSHYNIMLIFQKKFKISNLETCMLNLGILLTHSLPWYIMDNGVSKLINLIILTLKIWYGIVCQS